MSKHKVTIEIEDMPNGLGIQYSLGDIDYAIWPHKDGVQVEVEEDCGCWTRYVSLEEPEGQAIHALSTIILTAIRAKTKLKML